MTLWDVPESAKDGDFCIQMNFDAGIKDNFPPNDQLILVRFLNCMKTSNSIKSAKKCLEANDRMVALAKMFVHAAPISSIQCQPTNTSYMLNVCILKFVTTQEYYKYLCTVVTYNKEIPDKEILAYAKKNCPQVFEGDKESYIYHVYAEDSCQIEAIDKSGKLIITTDSLRNYLLG